MTARKPAHMTMPGWVDVQIRQAQEQGAFDHLAGLGKPITGLDTPRHELAWVADYLRRENVDVADVLPPALSIAREVEKLRERLVRERTEAAARTVVEDLNARIHLEHARPQTGVVFRVKLVRVEPALEQWRADRAALAELEALDRPARVVPDARPRRWFRTGRG